MKHVRIYLKRLFVCLFLLSFSFFFFFFFTEADEDQFILLYIF